MAAQSARTIVVTGATGLQGGAVARQLLAQGWQVRALTRNARGPKALALAAVGAQIFQGDMGQPATLAPVFEGAYGVFNVQNPVISGIEGEIRQGRNVAEAAYQAGVRHLVYGSAGTGARGTGVPSWESKLVIADHMRALKLPLTILRPMAFMEIMTEPKYFPQASIWHVMPALMGWDRPVVWLSVRDLGVIAAKAFAEPERYLGQDLALASDVQSLNQCRVLYAEVLGRNPPRFPMPPALFERFGFIGKDLGTMWRWLRQNEIPLDTKPTLAIHPQAQTVRDWLKTQRR